MCVCTCNMNITVCVCAHVVPASFVTEVQGSAISGYVDLTYPSVEQEIGMEWRQVEWNWDIPVPFAASAEDCSSRLQIHCPLPVGHVMGKYGHVMG